MVTPVRVRRGLLFWGLFLIPLGGISLLVRAGALDADRLSEAWRLWPLILIGIGLAIVLGRSRTAIAGTAVVALILGSLGGAALASGHLWVGALSDCAIASGPTDQLLQRSGTFDGAADVRLDLSCGTLDLTTVSGTSWQLDAAYRGPTPTVSSSPNGLDIRVPSATGNRRNDWTVRLPAAGASPAPAAGSLTLAANAASATLRLPASHLTSLAAEMNAGDLRIDASDATIDEVDLSMNAGRIRMVVGTASLSGDVSVNAGAIDLCVPDGTALRFHVTDQLTFVTNLASRGLARNGESWTRSGTAGGPTIDLSLDGGAASFSLNPEGGCR